MILFEMKSRLGLLIALLSFLAFASAKVVVHDESFQPDIILRATSQVIPRDCGLRESVVLNGTSPGPELRLKGGKTTWIRVYNDMSDQNLTMHWHGISQSVAPFSDGSPQSSQWPIPALHYFDYEVHPVIEEAGTYFYHSHVGFQSGTCAGALIVEDQGPPPYRYDEERIVFLGDYFNKSDDSITAGLQGNPFVWSGEANSLLVNGLSGTATNKTASCAPEVFQVEPDKTYRFRFISGSALSLITLALEGHGNLTVIEADGAYTKPYGTPHLQLGPGQRFSILLKTKSAAELKAAGKSTFWFQFENRERPPPMVRSFAVLSYTGGPSPAIPVTPPLSLPQQTFGFLEYSLEPLVADPSFPSTQEVTRRVYINVQQLVNGTIIWQENLDTWTPERVQVPYLVKIYENGQAAIPNYDAAIANGGWDPKTLAFPARIGEVLEIIWQNGNGLGGGWDVHPFHAHGEHFWDLGSGNGSYDPRANEQKLQGYHPVKRDTTYLYRYASSGVPQTIAGWRAWRIKVQNPGVWMLHCHSLQHMIMGMQTVWVFGNADDILNRVPRPDVSGYLTYGSNVNGNQSNFPTVNHYFAD